MGQNSSKGGKGLPMRTGKRKAKYPRYFANTAAKKARNVLKNGGAEALKAWKAAAFDKTYVSSAETEKALRSK
jgi:hypothetical protein